jgi:short-subunit dehydrogenase
MRWVLITGATGGIGREAALAFERDGMRVIATGRDPAKVATFAHGVVMDVTDVESVERAKVRVDEITGGYGVDVLVNNAGYGEMGPIETFSGARVRAMFETNVIGAARVIRAFVPKMRERRSGRIVQISSVLGRVTLATHGIYCATKHALEAMSDALRMELAPFGVGVVIVEPGSVATGFGDIAFGHIEDGGDPDWVDVAQRVRRLESVNRRMEIAPELVARAVVRAAIERSQARVTIPLSVPAQIAASHVLPRPLYEAVGRRMMGLRSVNARPRGGKRALITGAAGGIGRATAILLAKHGWKVTATDRDEDSLARFTREAKEQKLAIDARPMDVTDERSIAEVAKNVEIDALINNAGYAELGPVELADDVAWRAQLDVNVYGTLAVTRAFAPAMRRRRSGAIVNVTSVAGLVSFPFMGVYCASKFALEAITDALRLELGAFGVRVSGVQPSFIRSGFAARAKQTIERYALNAGPYAAMGGRMEQVIGRLDAVGGEVGDVAKAIVRALEGGGARYQAPFTAWIAARAVPFVPSMIQDRALARVFETHRLG